MGFSDKLGIKLASGFVLQKESPLDARDVVDTITDRDELVTINAAYEGILVYVKQDKTTYRYNGTSWETVTFGTGYTHPEYTPHESGFYKITVDSNGHVSEVVPVEKGDITKLGIPAQDTTYEDATQSQSGLMSSEDKTKLDGIEEGANNYQHPTHTSFESGIYKITVDEQGHITAAQLVSKQDIVSLGIPAQDTTYQEATTSEAGLMSSTDKAKLDGIQNGANNYEHPSYPQKESGLYKVTVDNTGHVSATDSVTKDDITKLGIPAQDTTYTPATQSQNGLMASSDKTKLDNIPTPSSIATQTYVAEQISAAGHITKSIVAELPKPISAKENVIYMVPKDEADDNSSYDEYMLIEGALEMIGNTKTVIDPIPNSEIDDLLNA